MNQWYIVQTKPHNENRVNAILTQASLETFNPKIHDIAYRALKPSYRIKSLFPSYLFLNIDFDKSENIHMIRYTRGVNKILSAGDLPLRVDQEIIDTIRGRMNPKGVIERQTTYQKGDAIRVTKGPLKDLIGILEKPVSATERVIVLLNLVNYKMKATLHWTQVEKVKAA